MKVIKVTKLKKKYNQFDISTNTMNFYCLLGNVALLVHNSPAIFCGTNPENGQFFVATKSLFNVVPKINYTEADIVNNHGKSLGLISKLKEALKYLSLLDIKNVLQGDLMYTKNDLEIKTIDGEKVITFQPNTIVYAVPVDSKLGQDILKSNIGIVFHTTYRGDSIQNLSASFGADVNNLNKTPKVWYQNAMVQNVSGSALFTAAETADYEKELYKCQTYASKIDKSFLKFLVSNSLLKSELNIFMNKNVREGNTISNANKFAYNFIKYVADKLESKSSSGKQSEKRLQALNNMRNHSSNLVDLFVLHKQISETKTKALRKLEQIESLKTFVRTDDGYKVTKPEGFVIIDSTGQNAVKIVDRLEFSRNNFTATKNWVKG